jgi:Ca2+-binding RTX toxin-like protein/GH24 family phage-related lysozyme (muramidase)
MNTNPLPNGQTYNQPEQLPAMLWVAEGCYPRLYDDTKGNPTMGIGLNIFPGFLDKEKKKKAYGQVSQLAAVLNQMTIQVTNKKGILVTEGVFVAAADNGVNGAQLIRALQDVMYGDLQTTSTKTRTGVTGEEQTLQQNLNDKLASLCGSTAASLGVSFSNFPPQAAFNSLQTILGQTQVTIGGIQVSPQGYLFNKALTNTYHVPDSNNPSANINTGQYEGLLSLYFNGPSDYGPGIENALQEGDNAQVWFQIRYETAPPGSGGGVVSRRYMEAQMYGLWQPGDTAVNAVQDYEMFTENRGKMLSYDAAHFQTASSQIEQKINAYNATNPGQMVQAAISPLLTLSEAFHPEAELLINQIVSQYGAMLPAGFLVDGYVYPVISNPSGSGSVFDLQSTDIFVAPDQTEVSNGFVASTAESITAGVDSPKANHIVIGPDSVGAKTVAGTGGAQVVLTASPFGNDILIAGAGQEQLNAGGGDDTLIAGAPFIAGGGAAPASNDTLNAGWGNDTFVIDLPSSASNLVETIKASSFNLSLSTDQSAVELYVAGQQVTLGGTQADPLTPLSSPGPPNTWSGAGIQYQYDFTTGILTISGGLLASNKIQIEDFNLAAAESSTGFLGIYLGGAYKFSTGVPSLSGNATPQVNALSIPMDSSSATLGSGQLEMVTISLGAPSNTPMTLNLSCSGFGVSASDFSIDQGGGAGLIPVNSAITIQPGQTSVTFALVNTGDIALATILTLGGTLTDAGGDVTNLSSLNINYQETTPDPFVDPVPGGTYGGMQVVGPVNNAILSYGLDFIINSESDGDMIAGSIGEASRGATPTTPPLVLIGSSDINVNNIVDEDPWNNGDNVITLNDHTDVVMAGDGDNRIYGNQEVSLATAIQQANAGGATGKPGSLITARTGDNTIVGSSGNDLIMVDTGNNVIVAGPGNDTIYGGVEPLIGPADWSTYGMGWESYLTGSAPPNYEGNVDPYGTPFDVGNDSIFGGSGSSLIELSNGDNYVDCGTGNSTVLGGTGDNTIFGGTGNVSILGGGGDDYIQGGSGADTLIGGDGYNTLMGGSGNSVIVANSGGADWATEDSQYNDLVEAGSGNVTMYGSGASSGSDTLMGGSGNDFIYAGDGNESIVGGTGNMAIQAGKGDDTIFAGDGTSTVYGSTASGSSALIYGGNGSDLIIGGSGSDTLYSGDGGTTALMTQVEASQTDAAANTTIYGGAGDNELFGGPGTAVIYGDAGTTAIVAGSGASTIYGGWGLETILGGSGTDLIYAGDGGDDSNPNVVQAGSGQAIIYGGGGASVLEDLSNGGDLIVSEDGTDTLIGSGGDTLVAGTGDDVLAGTGSGVTYEFNQGFGDDTISSVAGYGAGSSNIVFGTGMSESDFTADIEMDDDGEANLVISGDGGSITIENGVVPGQVGSTITFLDPSTPTFEEFMQDYGTDDDIAGANGDLILNVDDAQSLTSSTTGIDTLSAWGNNDTLTAGNQALLFVGGDNSLVEGGAYTDYLGASGNNDTLVASGYNELFSVANSSTVIEAQSNGSTDTVQSSVSFVLPENVQFMQLEGSNGLVATGNSLADIIIGNAGDDTLVAGSGLATLIGASDGNTFIVDNSGDVVENLIADAKDTIESSVNYALQTHFDTLILIGTNSLIGTGNDDATNLIVANSGNDTLIAGSGSDTFVGGSGGDVYVFNSGFGNTLITLGEGQQTIALETGITAGDVGIRAAVERPTRQQSTHIARGLLISLRPHRFWNRSQHAFLHLRHPARVARLCDGRTLHRRHRRPQNYLIEPLIECRNLAVWARASVAG